MGNGGRDWRRGLALPWLRTSAEPLSSSNTTNANALSGKRLRPTLQRVFRKLGQLDVALSIASLRVEGGERLCIPVLRQSAIAASSSRRLTATDLRHPLLSHGVGNDVEIGERGLFVTGSNMSGKSTFLRAVAVNAVLAQSLRVCTSASYQAENLRVMSVIQREDDLGAGTSYYLAELVEALERT